MNKICILAAVLAISALQGCATKTYGRQGALTGYEKEALTRREIELDRAKVLGFVDHVNKESEFSGRDVLAILSDFGIGKNLEKSAALESAKTRLDQLPPRSRVSSPMASCVPAATRSLCDATSGPAAY